MEQVRWKFDSNAAPSPYFFDSISLNENDHAEKVIRPLAIFEKVPPAGHSAELTAIDARTQWGWKNKREASAGCPRWGVGWL